MINSGFTLAFVLDILSDRPTEVWARMGSGLFTTNQNDVTAILNFAYVISSVVSFVATWVATAYLLRYYSRTIGDLKYWVTVSIPLVYFLSQFISLFLNLFTPYLESDPVFYGQLLTLIFTLSKGTGGIFFGMAFLFLTRNITARIVKVYLCIALWICTVFYIKSGYRSIKCILSTIWTCYCNVLWIIILFDTSRNLFISNFDLSRCEITAID